MFLKAFCDAAERPVWRLREKSGGEIAACPSVLAKDGMRLGEFSVAKHSYAIEGGRALRVLITDGAQIGVIVENMILETPRCVYTTFSVPRSEDLNCNVASKSRLVLRAGGRGAKLFRLANQVDGTDMMEGCGLLLPDGVTADAVGITPYSGMYAFGCRHLSVFAMAVEAEDKIKGWHMEGKETIEISAPDKSCRLRLLLGENSVTLMDPVLDVTAVVPLDF